MKNIGKPCAGKLHARFDEGGQVKLTMVRLVRHRQTKGAVNGYAKPTAQGNLFSTLPVGVFAQRTKYRPNPLAVTAVKLLGIEGNIVRVHALDALDGTPVLDIKPYMPPFDRMEDVKMPPWVSHFIEGYF